MSALTPGVGRSTPAGGVEALRRAGKRPGTGVAALQPLRGKDCLLHLESRFFIFARSDAKTRFVCPHLESILLVVRISLQEMAGATARPGPSLSEGVLRRIATDDQDSQLVKGTTWAALTPRRV